VSISFVHITGRADPKWEWYVDAICNQASPQELRDWQFTFVDRSLWAPWSHKASDGERIAFADPFYHNGERRLQLERIVNGRFRYAHVPTMPNQYQGPFRLTNKDWFYAGVARNSGIVTARHPYIMFCDDLALPLDQWLSQVRHAADHKYLLAGMYRKATNVVVDHGRLVSADDFPPGVDSRMSHGSSTGIVPWSGAGVFGCSFGVPLENALLTDGCGLEVAAQGADDYCWGIRLERTGLKVFLNKNCFTIESEEAHHTEPSLPRESKNVPADRLPSGYAGSTMSDHVHLNRLRREEDRILPLYPLGLRAIREEFLKTGMVPIPAGPQEDWRDGSPLSEL
jgi:hypothetical protein